MSYNVHVLLRSKNSSHKVTSKEAAAKFFGQLSCQIAVESSLVLKPAQTLCGAAELLAAQKVRYYFWLSIVCFGLDAGAKGKKQKL